MDGQIISSISIKMEDLYDPIRYTAIQYMDYDTIVALAQSYPRFRRLLQDPLLYKYLLERDFYAYGVGDYRDVYFADYYQLFNKERRTPLEQAKFMFLWNAMQEEHKRQAALFYSRAPQRMASTRRRF